MSMEGSNNSLSLPFITKVMDQHLVSDTRSCCICFGLAGNGIIVYLQSISNCKSLKSTGERTTDGTGCRYTICMSLAVQSIVEKLQPCGCQRAVSCKP